MTRTTAAFRVSLVILLITLLKTSAYAAAKPGDRFGDWTYECGDKAGQQTACVLAQAIVTKKDQRRLVTLTLTNGGKNGQPVLRALVPLGVHLPSGVAAAVDDGKPFALPVQVCMKQGCLAAVRLTAQQVNTLKSGDKLAIRFAVRPGKPLVVHGSLKGISEGLKAL